MTLKSWLPSANGDTDFPIQNLPYGVFDDGHGARMGVAIGDMILDVACVDHGLDAALFDAPSWNAVMAAGPDIWVRLRCRLTDLLSNESHKAAIEPHLVEQGAVRMLMPFDVAEYTDFYAGKNHAVNVGTMFRGPENALPPNWLSIPIGYNGRASSVVVSGTDVTRPWGQLKGPNDDLPRFAQCARFDFELEMGAIVGAPSSGMVSVQEADDMIFGYVLLNDWSARDIQGLGISTAWSVSSQSNRDQHQPVDHYQSCA